MIRRRAFVSSPRWSIAALLVACLSLRSWSTNWPRTRRAAEATPIVVSPFAVLGECFRNGAPRARRSGLLAHYSAARISGNLYCRHDCAGLRLCAALCRARKRSHWSRLPVSPVPALSCSWLLAQTLGDINDLGLRAIIPAEIVPWSSSLPRPPVCQACRARAVACCALGGLVLSLPGPDR